MRQYNKAITIPTVKTNNIYYLYCTCVYVLTINFRVSIWLENFTFTKATLWTHYIIRKRTRVVLDLLVSGHLVTWSKNWLPMNGYVTRSSGGSQNFFHCRRHILLCFIYSVVLDLLLSLSGIHVSVGNLVWNNNDLESRWQVLSGCLVWSSRRITTMIPYLNIDITKVTILSLVQLTLSKYPVNFLSLQETGITCF